MGVKYHHGFDLQFLNDLCLASFHVCWPFVYLVWRNVCSSPFLIFNVLFFLLSFMSFLYILDIRPFPGKMVCKYFLPFSVFTFIIMSSFLLFFNSIFLKWYVHLEKNYKWTSHKREQYGIQKQHKSNLRLHFNVIEFQRVKCLKSHSSGTKFVPQEPLVGLFVQ